MENNEANKILTPTPEQLENIEGIGDISSLNDAAIYTALQKAGEPIQIAKEPPTMFGTSELGAVSPREDAERLRKLVVLIKLSPQYQLFYAVEKYIFNWESRALVDDLLSKGKLTDAEATMFDPNRINPNPQWPLLFKPLLLSDELKSKIKSRVRTLSFTTDPAKAIAEGLSRAIGVTGITTPRSKEKFSLTKSLKPLIKRVVEGSNPLTYEDIEGLMGDAYKDLTDRFGNFESVKVYIKDEDPPWTGAQPFVDTDYSDPRLLMLEELQQRGYDINLFKFGTFNGSPLKEVLLIVSDKEDFPIVQNCFYSFFYDLYSQDVHDQDYLRRENIKLPDAYGLSEKERKDLLLWSLVIGVRKLQEEIAFERRPGKKHYKSAKEKLESKKVEIKQLKDAGAVVPDQAYFRRLMSGEVDKDIKIQEEISLEEKNK